MKTFKYHIAEESKEDFVEKFGHILFGTFRRKRERDTDYEAGVFKLLARFIEQSTDKRKRNIAKYLPLLKQAQRYYPDVLETPHKYLYRGQAIRRKDFKSIVKQYKGDRVERNWVNFNNVYTYRARTKIQSWTTSWEIAEMFAGNYYHTGPSSWYEYIPAVMEYYTDDDFIFNPKFLNTVSSRYIDEIEYEVIRFSKKPIKTTLYIQQHTYDKWIEENE